MNSVQLEAFYNCIIRISLRGNSRLVPPEKAEIRINGLTLLIFYGKSVLFYHYFQKNETLGHRHVWASYLDHTSLCRIMYIMFNYIINCNIDKLTAFYTLVSMEALLPLRGDVKKCSLNKFGNYWMDITLTCQVTDFLKRFNIGE